MAGGESEQSHQLLNELMNCSGVSKIWQTSEQLVQSAALKESTQNALMLTTHFKRDHLEWQFFSTIATLGTSYDITLQ